MSTSRSPIADIHVHESSEEPLMNGPVQCAADSFTLLVGHAAQNRPSLLAVEVGHLARPRLTGSMNTEHGACITPRLGQRWHEWRSLAQHEQSDAIEVIFCTQAECEPNAMIELHSSHTGQIVGGRSGALTDRIGGLSLDCPCLVTNQNSN